MRRLGSRRIWSARRVVKVRSRVGIRGVRGGQCGRGAVFSEGLHAAADIGDSEDFGLDLGAIFSCD